MPGGVSSHFVCYVESVIRSGGLLCRKVCCEVCNLSQRPVISCEDRYNRKSVISRDLLYREVCYGSLLYREFFI